jgi:hypothetical protein
MKNVAYKGFEISPVPKPCPENQWELGVTIIKHHDPRETLEKLFTGSRRFNSKDEAEKYGIEYGKQIIDGKYPDLTLDEIL